MQPWHVSGSSQSPWSNSPNAPQISPSEYISEKTNFTGAVIAGTCYGIVVILFFRCMSTLLCPADRITKNIRWSLVAHTVAMFSFVTVFTVAYLDLEPISFIDNREYRDVKGAPGPLGYQYVTYSETINILPRIVFVLNNWLADGLLLYRCCIILSMNYGALVLPCLIYLATLVMGAIIIYYQISQQVCSAATTMGMAYFPISMSLNVLITFMIVIRLILHSRDLRNALGPLMRPSGLYTATVTMLIESSALYAVTYLLFIGPWVAGSSAQFIFFPILAQTQVISQFLIILRVSSRRALTREVVSGDISSVHFGGNLTSGGVGSLPAEHAASATVLSTSTLEELEDKFSGTTVDSNQGES